MKHPKILISACLLGEKVKYDGKDNRCDHFLVRKWRDEGLLVPICPEVLGGLGVPRLACEICQKTAKVINTKGEDKTEYFLKGAVETLKIAHNEGIKMAILKARSPSCGKDKIYDGSFTHTLIDGSGITCKLLQKNGVTIFSEEELEHARVFWNEQG